MTEDSDEKFGLHPVEPALSTLRAIARLDFQSTGTLASAIEGAIILTINQKEAARLDIPQETGTWSERFNIAPFLIEDASNDIEITVNSYDFMFGGGTVITNANVGLWIGSRNVFREGYSTRSGYRKSVETLKFNPSSI